MTTGSNRCGCVGVTASLQDSRADFSIKKGGAELDLYAELSVYDGKNVSALEPVAALFSPDDESVTRLCDMAEEADELVQAAAIWLLKHIAEKGYGFLVEQEERLIDLIGEQSLWQANLMLLQILSWIKIPDSCKSSLYENLKRECECENKFQKAWAFNGLIVLADQYAKYRPWVKKKILAAYGIESASIKARIRNASKACSWLKL